MQTNQLKIEYLPLDGLIPYARNSRTHSDEQVAQIAASIREFGFTNPVLVDEDGGIIAGHGRVLASRKLKLNEVPCITLAGLTDAQKSAYVIADNKLALNAGWDFEMLSVELDGLNDAGYDVSLLGFSADELSELIGNPNSGLGDNDGNSEPGNGSLAERFMVPPFSVLNAREGWWQDRKRAWIAQGILSEMGRGDNLLKFRDAAKLGGCYPKDEAKSKFGKCLETGIGEQYGRDEMNGTSIFDPVLCELAYLWFSPMGGIVLDPFAGGSVRGIVAGKLGRQYIGHELRGEQVAANREQAEGIFKPDDLMPAWIEGDSRGLDKTCADVQADFVFSCPPYADLDVYSDDPLDLSTLGYPEFKAAYFEIIKKACAQLKNDRFACFVVGEVRDKKGAYYDFVGDTVQAFKDAGLSYYNEIILVTAVGSLPIRAGRQFSAGRKVGKTHQNVLVFCKGDGKKAAQACGTVDIPEDVFGQLEAESAGC